ncbi:MAG: hypothetical protein O6849_07155 [Candidatus Dadabacteria bacterium]|nr:hypothetical protein [Candidatus Dadabacteria bacterium]
MNKLTKFAKKIFEVSKNQPVESKTGRTNIRQGVKKEEWQLLSW